MLHRASPEDLEEVRRTRLDALTRAPSAYGSTVQRERAYPDAVWLARLQPDANPTFLWRDDAGVHGMVVGAPDPDDPVDARLYAMWVRPESRGSGVADALVEAVLEWAAVRRSGFVRLHVTEGNRPAERLYERHGFAACTRGGARDHDGRVEIEYERRLDA